MNQCDENGYLKVGLSYRDGAEIPLAAAHQLEANRRQDEQDLAGLPGVKRAIATRVSILQKIISDGNPGWVQHYLEYLERVWKSITDQQPSNKNFKTISELGLRCLGVDFEIKDYEIEKMNIRVRGYDPKMRMGYGNVNVSIEDRLYRRVEIEEGIRIYKILVDQNKMMEILDIMQKYISKIPSFVERDTLKSLVRAAIDDEYELRWKPVDHEPGNGSS